MCVCMSAEFLFHFAIQNNIANIYVYKSYIAFPFPLLGNALCNCIALVNLA